MKKIISIILTIAMLICSSQVLAYENESNTGIVKTGGGVAQSFVSGGSTEPAQGKILYGGYYCIYSDVDPNHWAYDSIKLCKEKGLFNGYPDGSFRPNVSITRAEALKVFVEFLGLEVTTPVMQSSYYDVDINDWYAPYIEAGKDLLPVHTTIQGRKPFNPNISITREDATYALTVALGYMEKNGKPIDESVLNMFTDKSSISDSLKPYISVALKEGLIAGYEDHTFRGQHGLSRAEFATILARGSQFGFHDYKAKIESVSLVCGEEVSLDIGDVLNLNATAVMSDNTKKIYTDMKPYIISGKKAVTIDDSNSVTAIDVGVAKIGFEDEYLKNTLTITVKTPSTKPVLKIYDYPDETEDAKAIIKGKTTDANGSDVDLTCNGKDIAINDDGTFSVEVNLKIGENLFKFTSENRYHAATEKTVAIIRTKSGEIQSTDLSETENTQDTDEDSNNQESEEKDKVCDPSQGIDAGRNDDDGPGEFTPDPGTVNGEFIPSPQTGILSEYPLSGFTSISGRISKNYGKNTDNYNNRYDTFFDSAGHSFSSKNKLEYLLDNKYYWLSGTVYIPNGETYDGHGMLQIIGDGRVLWSSPDMTKISKPIPFTVSLKGVNDLIIQFETSNITVCLGNAVIYGSPAK